MGQSIQIKDSIEVHQTDTIYFDFGRAVIKPEAKRVLQKIWEDKLPDLELYLEGHTDAVGSNSANENLAHKRVTAVEQFMGALGWESDKIITRSFGEKRLLVPTQAREERNRRVFIRSGLPQRYHLFRGRAVDSLGNPLPSSVIAHGKYLQDSTRSDANGYFSIWLPINQVVGLDIYAPGYLYSSQYFKVSPTAGPNFNMVLKKATAGAKMDVPDLFFVGNKATLLPSGKKAIKRLLSFMQRNPGLTVEIAGHVNWPGLRQKEGTFSWNLATARANFVREYLIHRGVDPNML
ncbi:MAG: OmpA family protein, partial [Bacteroidota bacterium]